MAIEDRRQRERVARHRLITATARTVPESEGWDAITTRRSSAAIEDGPPVLHQHFGSMADTVEAVVLEGFAELIATLRAARRGGVTHDVDLSNAARIGHARAPHCPEARTRRVLMNNSPQVVPALGGIRASRPERGRRRGHPDRVPAARESFLDRVGAGETWFS